MVQQGDDALILSEDIALSDTQTPVTGEGTVVYEPDKGRGDSEPPQNGQQVILVSPTLAQSGGGGDSLPNPQHWWKYDGSATDFGTIGNADGTLNGNATYATGGPAYERQLELDGTDGTYVDCGDPGFNNTEWKNHTHTFWVRIDSYSGSRQVWEASQEDGDEVRVEFDSFYDDGLVLALRNNTGNPRYSNDDAGSDADFDQWGVVIPTSEFSYGTWFWVAAVLDAENTEMRIYKDGSNLIDTRSIPSDLVPNFGKRLVMGSDSTQVIRGTSGQLLDGGIVDYRMYQSVLSDAQIQDVYEDSQ